MNIYLKYINPVVAIMVFLLCAYSSIKIDDNKPILILNMFSGSFPSYFFAKGVFCGLSLFLFGKILEEIRNGNNR